MCGELKNACCASERCHDSNQSREEERPNELQTQNCCHGVTGGQSRCFLCYCWRPDGAGKKTPVAKKAKTPPGPTVEEQIQSLRQEFQGQIDGLKSNLADKDAQLKQAQQAAADAQAAAAKAQAAADCTAGGIH